MTEPESGSPPEIGAHLRERGYRDGKRHGYPDLSHTCSTELMAEIETVKLLLQRPRSRQ